MHLQIYHFCICAVLVLAIFIYFVKSALSADKLFPGLLGKRTKQYRFAMDNLSLFTRPDL
ncbi:hypothetical protein ECMP02101711_0364 [Escherichia coli MP021017.11]|nr:hypothetical protein ECMP02101711_0364 [Escherichia coli MP021017.11]